MKIWIAMGFAVMCAVGVGCDYTVPLAATPALEIDKAVVGLWERPTSNGQVERLLVLPLDGKEYLVAYPAGGKDTMYARACLCRAGDLTLVQLKWFGTARGNAPDDSRIFQFASYSAKGEALQIRMLNDSVVDREAVSSAALVKAIAAQKENAARFKEEMVFRKVAE